MRLPSSSKYGNKRTAYNGRFFASKREAHRAWELDMLKRAGVITSWLPQPEFKIVHNEVKICSYFADFKVFYPNGSVEYEDVKGMRTDVFILKKKLVKAFYNIEIKEIR